MLGACQSPAVYPARCSNAAKTDAVIVARYDLTFPIRSYSSGDQGAQDYDLPLDVFWLPCGHYTTAEMPWKAIDAWKIATFFRKHFR